MRARRDVAAKPARDEITEALLGLAVPTMEVLKRGEAAVDPQASKKRGNIG